MNLVTGALLTVHELAAVLLKIPEVEIDEMEALALAKALLAVQRCYPQIDISAHALAWVGLIAACGRVYVPHFAAYKIRVKTEAGQRPAKMQAIA